VGRNEAADLEALPGWRNRDRLPHPHRMVAPLLRLVPPTRSPTATSWRRNRTPSSICVRGDATPLDRENPTNSSWSSALPELPSGSATLPESGLNGPARRRSLRSMNDVGDRPCQHAVWEVLQPGVPPIIPQTREDVKLAALSAREVPPARSPVGHGRLIRMRRRAALPGRARAREGRLEPIDTRGATPRNAEQRAVPGWHVACVASGAPEYSS